MNLIVILVFALGGILIFAMLKGNIGLTVTQNRPDNTDDINESIEYLKNKRPIEHNCYVPNEKTYGNFLNHYRETPALSAMAKDILRHVGLPNNSVPVYVVDDLDENVAGSYSQGMYGTCIELRIRDDSQPAEVMAILIHECMHYYLQLTRLGFSDRHKNEILTDTATVYFGFLDFMVKGYTRSGYISQTELYYIDKMLQD